MGKIWVVGFGPGDVRTMTGAAREALAQCDTAVGYTTYIRLVRGLLDGKEIVQTGMRQEVARARDAVARARAGRQVAVVSSGDAGIYGMAGLVYEVLLAEGWQPGDNPEVEVVPGVPALVAAAALLGAPLMHDFAAISLSDLLTPWETIARRLDAAAAADFVIALYNPRSARRTEPFAEARAILGRHRSPDTPVGVVHSAYREQQRVKVTTLAELDAEELGMLTILIVGNSQTRAVDDRMVTPRGYGEKYQLAAEEPELGDKVTE